MMRRNFLTGLGAALWGTTHTSAGQAAEGSFEVTRSDDAWRTMLGPDAFKVMRQEGTERAGSSPLNAETRNGVFHCKGCDQALYSSDTKFDSGTGWPSFWQPLPDAVATREDRRFFMTRIECHCDRCGSHLGHIFDDGPQPTGLRHCINGISLTFRPA